MSFQLRRAAPSFIVVASGRGSAASAGRRLVLCRPPIPGAWRGVRQRGCASASSTASTSSSSSASSSATSSVPPYPQSVDDPAERELIIARIAAQLVADPALCNRVGLAIDDRTATRLSTPWTSGEVPRPALRQLSSVVLRNAIPFVGFGFFDNMIMLTTGEAIDETFGVAFGFSTLAAAGMGQMVSDAAGITLQGLIERFADSLGLPDPGLSREQQTSNLVQWIVLFSRVVGIIVGCFFGMFPLLLMPNKEPRFVDYADNGTLSASSRRELMQLVETRTHEKGEILIPMGELCEHMILVQSGKLRVVGHDHTMLNKPFTVTVLEPGQVFGEPQIFAPSPVVIVAEEASRVQWVPKAELLRLTGKEGAAEVWERNRNKSVGVYIRAHGPVFTGKPQAVQGTGKTRFFVSLTAEDKLDLLECTGKDAASWGSTDEDKISFFSGLSQEEKSSAIFTWQHDSRKHEHLHEHETQLHDSFVQASMQDVAAVDPTDEAASHPLEEQTNPHGQEPAAPTRPCESRSPEPVAPAPLADSSWRQRFDALSAIDKLHVLEYTDVDRSLWGHSEAGWICFFASLDDARQASALQRWHLDFGGR